MGLSKDLINSFVEITNDKVENKQETTMYGTIVLHGGKRYVQIDGSELLTPIKATVDAIPGDRVTVLVKDHSVIVNGSTTSPSARKAGLDAINDHIDAEFDDQGHIVNSKIDIMDSHISTMGSQIEAIDSDIFIDDSGVSVIGSIVSAIDSDILVDDSGVSVIGSKVNAIDSDILVDDSGVSIIGSKVHAIDSDYYTYDSQGQLVDSKVNIINSVFTIEDGVIKKIKGINAEFANFKSANIDEATMKKLFADSGIIQEVITKDSKVTGTLVGVTIIGDSIQSGSIRADKLVILGDDGLYYKLNANAEGIKIDPDTGEIISHQDRTNSIDGSIITAKSIVAEQVAVTDLVAFQATIANFHLIANAIYSGAKSSIDNTTTGIYMDSDGQMCIGDGSNYVKYYKDTNGKFKLDIHADSLSYTGLDEIQNKLGRIEVGTSSGRPYIELGAEGSDFKLRITNNKIEFKEGSTTPAWISDEKLYIEQAEVTDEFKFGGFVWSLHGSGTNKNLGLVWKGAS